MQQNRQRAQTRTLGMLLIVLLYTTVCFGEDLSRLTGTLFRLPSVDSGSTVFPLSLQGVSSSSFNGWYRYPAEDGQWLPMTDTTAYFRDVFVAGETYIAEARDGDSWTASAQRPDGSTTTWAPITFQSSYRGEQNCFVAISWYTCETTSLYVLWFTSSQCRPPGQWTMNFYQNGNQFFSGRFTLLPQIPPDKVPLLNQLDYNDQKNASHTYDSICRTKTKTGQLLKDVFPCGLEGSVNEAPWTIAGKGCYLVDAVMILGYHGVQVTPPSLNTWLINYKDKKGNPLGYRVDGAIYPVAIAVYARQQGVKLTYDPPVPKEPGNLEELERLICAYGPHIFGVRENQHFVTAIGRDAERTTYQIHDPEGGVATTLTARDNNDKNNKKSRRRVFAGQQFTFTDITGIQISYHSPGELVLTDPQGRRIGYDPTKGVEYNEIPDAYYATIGLADDETGEPGPETKDLYVPRPLAGDYLLQVIGTGTGTYTLQIIAYDPELETSGDMFKNIAIAPNEVHAYAFYYPKAVGVDTEISGGFDGGGQRPRDVNKFLSYSIPSESQTHLSAGTTIYALMIFYDKNIIPSSFKAELNGVNIASRFSPRPGSYQIVTLNLQSGRNVLVLSMDGNLPNRIATDTDRLVFVVP